MSTEFEVAGFKPGVLVAGEDLSSYQFHPVKVHTDGTVLKSGEGEYSVGILQNKPVAGEACEIDMDGISKGMIGDTIANAGTKLKADTDSRLVAAGSGDHVVAQLLVPSVVDGQLAAVKVIGAAGQLLA